MSKYNPIIKVTEGLHSVFMYVAKDIADHANEMAPFTV